MYGHVARRIGLDWFFPTEVVKVQVNEPHIVQFMGFDVEFIGAG